MSQGKFSQPRPHRDEERQIEESFRQLTEEKPRRRKNVYNVEPGIRQTVQEISAQDIPLSEASAGYFDKDAQLEQRIPVSAEQPVIPRQPQPSIPRQTAAPVRPGRYEHFDLIPEDTDAYFQTKEKIPAEDFEEAEPDFIDKLMNLGSFFRKHQTAAVLGLCVAALILIGIFVAVFFAGGSDPHDNTILENVFIADVNVGGMTKNEAISAVKKATDKTYSHQDMVIDLSGTELRLSPKDTKAKLDVKAAVNAAYDYGRTGSQSQRDQAYQDSLEDAHIIAVLPYLELNTDYIRQFLTTYAEDSGSTLTQTSYGLEGDEPELSADKFNEKAPTQTLVITMGTPGIGFDVNDVYAKVLDAYSLHLFLVSVENVESVSEPDPIDLEAIYKEFYIEPVNASVNMQNFKTEPGSYGYGFDLEAAQKLVDNAEFGEVLRIPMEYIEPDILDDDSFFRDTLGEHQTRATGNDNRNTNLHLACEAINGTVLNPGETLSFSSSLGNVRGFQDAPEDTGREEVSQGGVSQVASTLYYAALMSDLDIASRSNHSYVPSFIDYGLDATPGLTIRNATGFPIRIEAALSGGYVKVKILGTEERNYYVMLESSISSSTAANTVYEEFAYDNDEGYEDGDVIEEGSAGYLVKSYKVKYDRRTGKELSRDFIVNTQYPAVDRVIARVEEPEETTVPTEEPTRPTEATRPHRPTWPQEPEESFDTEPTEDFDTEPTEDFESPSEDNFHRPSFDNDESDRWWRSA